MVPARAVIEALAFSGMCVTGVVQMILLVRSLPEGKVWVTSKVEEARWVHRTAEPRLFYWTVALKFVVWGGLFAVLGFLVTASAIRWLVFRHA
jgi:hypothetical protein